LSDPRANLPIEGLPQCNVQFGERSNGRSRVFDKRLVFF